MSKQTEAAEAVLEFLYKIGSRREDYITVDHPHNGRISIQAGYIWELCDSVKEVTYARQDHD